MTTNNNDWEAHLKALQRMAMLGQQILAVRLLSFTSVIGALTLAGYVAYKPSLEGLGALLVVAALVVIPALKAETNHGKETQQ